MSDEGRGMKKWAPFASLVEQGEAIEKMRYQRNKIDKPTISTEEAEKINNILANYKKGDEVEITFYYDGYLYKVKTIIKRIDKNKKALILPDGTLSFKDIVNITAKVDYFDF